MLTLWIPTPQSFPPLPVKNFPSWSMLWSSLFWIGANYYQPVDLPDTTGLCWREAIIRCLESIYPLSRTPQDPEPSPPSPRCEVQGPEPTTDREPEPIATNEPSPRKSLKAEDRHGARASRIVRPCARASYNARHEGESCGQ